MCAKISILNNCLVPEKQKRCNPYILFTPYIIIESMILRKGGGGRSIHDHKTIELQNSSLKYHDLKV